MLEVDALDLLQKAVHEVLARLLAVGDDVDPRVLLLLDNFQNFRADYDASIARSVVYNAFGKILSQGRSVGIHVALSADRTASVPNAMSATIQKKVILRQTDDDGYLIAGVPRDVLTPASPPGRGMLADNPQELQLAILGDDGTPGVQAELVGQMAIELARFYPVRPPEIRSLPVNVPASGLPRSVNDLPVLGVEYATLEAMGFDPRGPIIVTGPPSSGRTTALLWLAESIHRWSPETALIRLSARPSSLDSQPFWAASVTGQQNVASFLAGSVKQDLADPTGARPAVAIFIEQYAEFAGTAAESALADAAVLARRNGHPFFAEGEPSALGGFPSFISEVRQARCGLVLQPDVNDGDNLFRTPLPGVRRVDFPPGRGVWVRSGKVSRVQVPMVE